MKYFLAACCLLASAYCLAQTAILTKDISLKSHHQLHAPDAASLTEGTPVTLIKRKGGWYEVETLDQQRGWLSMLDVRFVSDQEAKQSNIAEILKQTTINPTASGTTTGVRGLGEEQLHNKSEDGAAVLEVMRAYVPSEDSLQDFQEQGQLESKEALQLPQAP